MRGLEPERAERHGSSKNDEGVRGRTEKPKGKMVAVRGTVLGECRWSSAKRQTKWT